jgi:hypothetical protein
MKIQRKELENESIRKFPHLSKDLKAFIKFLVHKKTDERGYMIGTVEEIEKTIHYIQTLNKIPAVV